MVGEQKKFEITTPYGTMVAIESPDMKNPGIVIMFLDPSEAEYVSCSMQVLPKTNSLATQIYRGGDCSNVICGNTKFLPAPCEKCPYAQGKISFMDDPCPDCRKNGWDMFRTLASQFHRKED